MAKVTQPYSHDVQTNGTPIVPSSSDPNMGLVPVGNADGSAIGGSSGGGGGNNTYSNASGDFTATANSGAKTITLSAYASTILSAVISAKNFVNGSIKRISTAGDVDTLPLSNVSFAANVLTLSDMSANFAAGDTVVVTVIGPDKAFDEANDQGKVTLNTAIAGEDIVNDVLKVEQRWSAVNITLAAPTTTLVKTGVGLLHSIIINKPLANGVITIYDGVDATGTLLGTITKPATLLSDLVNAIIYDIPLTVGLCIVTSGAAQDITVTYR